ncbi:DNA-binding response regulator [Lentzea sp. NBRC 105346]|uniref:response regulator transcription factor n=1 Tax=Lentzea sp. NBRC 105346 TaxID=3032205 RepID=UPI0024A3CCD2|nr:response regulator transcription factor [Lentzea sp. NBRC 105346]GLZ34939.1 DNA-binding response regulator [Lentzea sp. NBRC 105346]
MTTAGRVLVVEDETSLASALADGLRQDGFDVETVHDGMLALDASLNRPFDVIVLDLMLPGLAGLDVCAQIRRAGIDVPVLVLTARRGELDQLRALRIGADDFLSKPFSYRVLVARLHALLRRSGPRRSDVLAAGDLVLDRVSRRCRRDSSVIDLTPREFSLLELLMSRAGQVVSKRLALDEVWDAAMPDDSNVLEVYVAYLRRKIDLPFGRHAIRTVRGSGYSLDPHGG